MRLISYLNDPAGGLLAAQRRDNDITGYLYTWPEQANVQLGKILIGDSPYAVLLTPSEWRIETDQSVAREVATLHIYYLLQQPRLDFDATANETLIDRCIAAATDLVARARSDRRCAIVSATMQGLSLYDVGDRNLTGIRLALTLRDNAGYCLTDYNTLC